MCFLPSEEDNPSDLPCLQIHTYSEYQSGHSCFETKQMIASCDIFPHDLCSIFKVTSILFWNRSLEEMYTMLSDFQELSLAAYLE